MINASRLLLILNELKAGKKTHTKEDMLVELSIFRLQYLTFILKLLAGILVLMKILLQWLV